MFVNRCNIANNYLEFLFGINENMTDNHGIITAGSSWIWFFNFSIFTKFKKRNWMIKLLNQIN